MALAGQQLVISTGAQHVHASIFLFCWKRKSILNYWSPKIILHFEKKKAGHRLKCVNFVVYLPSDRQLHHYFFTTMVSNSNWPEATAVIAVSFKGQIDICVLEYSEKYLDDNFFCSSLMGSICQIHFRAIHYKHLTTLTMIQWLETPRHTFILIMGKWCKNRKKNHY